MPIRASLSVLLLSLLAAAGCGARNGLGLSGGSTTGATSTVGSGGSTGSVISTTGAGGSGGATGAGGSGGSTSTATGGSGGATGIPGTFTSCAWEMVGGSGVYPGSTAIAQQGAFTVTQTGSTLAVTYVDEYSSNVALTFDQTTGTSAVLAAGGATLGGPYDGICVFGPGDTDLFPAQFTASAGTLDTTSGAVFLTVEGTIAPTGTPPCSAEPAPASLWIVCGEGEGWAPAPPSSGAPAPPIPAGTYTCGSEIGTYDVANGYTLNASGSGSGTLEITQTGATTTATYTGNDGTSGTLDFTAASSTAAYAAPGQTLSTPCNAPYFPNGPPPSDTETPVPLPVTAGVATIDGTTLFLMFSGTMTSSICPGALKRGALVCSTP
jgi:hypothetical protein